MMLVKRNFVERKLDGKHILIYLREERKSLFKEIYENSNKIYLGHLEILNKNHSQ